MLRGFGFVQYSRCSFLATNQLLEPRVHRSLYGSRCAVRCRSHLGGSLAAFLCGALRPRMGKKASKGVAPMAPRGEKVPCQSLQDFASALAKQLATKNRLIRTFDVGGTGVKTALFSAPSLQSFLEAEGERELDWIEAPTSLGQAPGEEGFDAWLASVLPKLQNEKANGHVAFGVSTAGDLEHATGILHDWWSAGGHPRQWEGDGRADPHVAELMGLPRDRTFILHDGAAHLLGCSRCMVPPPRLACFSVGTGVGFGISDEEGAVVDPSSTTGARSHFLNGVPLSGASYRGLWRDWVARTEHVDDVEQVMRKEFANMGRPWSFPWVSLVLGRRGMELAEAAFGCPPPERGDDGGAGPVLNTEVRKASSEAYAQQSPPQSNGWAHFLQTQPGSPEGRVFKSGGVATSGSPRSSARALVDIRWIAFALLAWSQRATGPACNRPLSPKVPSYHSLTLVHRKRRHPRRGEARRHRRRRPTPSTGRPRPRPSRCSPWRPMAPRSSAPVSMRWPAAEELLWDCGRSEGQKVELPPAFSRQNRQVVRGKKW
ncbi:unnamed protein product [Durusdinium trenchii]|uniref:Uncharacterized protein n=1 Tax=Durusdinium trenchii TaxID=1381693 RepID=A0ABP0M5X4_9DINO